MMTSRERIAAAMSLQVPDRVPYRCQLSGQHIIQNTIPAGQASPSTIEPHTQLRLSRRPGCGAFGPRLPRRGHGGGGYILSTACSTAPDVRPGRMIQIRELVMKYGRY